MTVQQRLDAAIDPWAPSSGAAPTKKDEEAPFEPEPEPEPFSVAPKCAACAAAAPSRPYFTPCDVAQHATLEDGWVSAHGVVYDISGYAEHPGGLTALRRHVGTDCSEDFDFHGAKARKAWARFAIGRLRPCEGGGGGGGRCVVS